MKKAIELFKTHPASVICYIIYTAFCCMMISFTLEFNASFDHIKPGEGVEWGGQGVLFGVIFTSIIAVIFIVVMMLNALLAKTGQSFYWWICLFILAPLFILISII